MNSNNWWLYQQLLKIDGVDVAPSYRPLIQASKGNHIYKIYTPTPHEYLITIDIVQTVNDLGGNTISYPTHWCRASREAVAYGKVCGVDVMPHGRLFELLDRA